MVISLKTEMINDDDTAASHMRNEGARRRALDVVADDGVNQIGVQQVGGVKGDAFDMYERMPGAPCLIASYQGIWPALANMTKGSLTLGMRLGVLVAHQNMHELVAPQRHCPCRREQQEKRRRYTTPHYRQLLKGGEHHSTRLSTSYTAVPVASRLAMSSSSDSAFFATIVPAYQSVRDRLQPTSYERNIAFLESHHLRTLNPTPITALASSSLLLSFPSPLVNSSSPFHYTPPLTFLLPSSLSFTPTFIPSLIRSHNRADTSPEHVHLMLTALTPADQLLLWLFHLACHLTIMLQLPFAHHHPSIFFCYIYHVNFCANTALSTSIPWQTAEERKMRYGMMSACRTAVAVLDGTHCRVQQCVFKWIQM